MKIITHNVYWFQGSPPRWGEERVAEVDAVFDALAELYASASPDLVCLQEVHRDDLAATLARRLNMTCWLHAPGGILADYGAAVLCRTPATLKDRSRLDGAFAHERTHVRISVDSPLGPLEVAAVHLPSNRRVTSGEQGEAARIAELTRILHTPPRPAVVLGDMNCLPDSAPPRLISEAGYVDTALAGAEPVTPSWRTRIDYAWLDRPLAPRLRAFRLLDAPPFLQSAASTPWRLSDHPPLLLELG